MLIYLIGLPGAGKTTIGKEIAKEFNYQFIDLDEEIEKSFGLDIPTIFETRGEDYFREVEQLELYKTFQLKDTIISCGGGTPCFFDNIEQINIHGKSIYLKINPDTILKRLSEQEIQNRPLFKKDSLNDLLKKRELFYNKASFIVDSNNLINTTKDIIEKLN